MTDKDTIKATRGLYGWSQEQLAEHIGMDRSSVSRMENGLMIARGPAAKLLRNWIADAPQAPSHLAEAKAVRLGSKLNRFDHDKARALHASGMPYCHVAERLGVSAHSVRLACNPELRQRENMRNKVSKKRRAAVAGAAQEQGA